MTSLAPHATAVRPPIAVLGPGLMGSQIGVEFALRGFPVYFLGRDPGRDRQRVVAVLQRATSLGLCDSATADAASQRIEVVADATAIPVAIQLAIECLPERLDTKVTVLTALAAHAPDAILATNTSSFAIGEIGSRIGAAERTVGMHYWNPPLLMPLVEVTAGPATSSVALQIARDAVEAVGKIVVPVQRDVPGFIWNRLQMALLREALWLLDNDVASIEAIDQVARLGLARRWRQTGFFGSIHLGGGDTWEAVAANLFPQLSCASDASGLARRMHGEQARWYGLERRRDEGLAHDPVS